MISLWIKRNFRAEIDAPGLNFESGPMVSYRAHFCDLDYGYEMGELMGPFRSYLSDADIVDDDLGAATLAMHRPVQVVLEGWHEPDAATSNDDAVNLRKSFKKLG